MTEIEIYTLGLLTEECGEVSQIVGKCLRFGIDTHKHQNEYSPTGRDLLNLECGDILAAIEYGIKKSVLNERKIYEQMNLKLTKLLDPNSVASSGGRLAP